MEQGTYFSLTDEPIRILVVDDEENILWSLSQNLTLANDAYCVGTAASAEEALAMLESTPVDILITDYKLPEMSGVDLIRSVQASFPSTRSILMTAYGNNSVMNDVDSLGGFAYMEKPFSIDRLLDHVSSSGELEPMRITAELSEVSLGDLLRLCCLKKEDAMLEVFCENQIGKIYVKEGVLVEAQMGELPAPDALLEMLAEGSRVVQGNVDEAWSNLPQNMSLAFEKVNALLEAKTPLARLRIIQNTTSSTDPEEVTKKAEPEPSDDAVEVVEQSAIDTLHKAPSYHAQQVMRTGQAKPSLTKAQDEELDLKQEEEEPAREDEQDDFSMDDLELRSEEEVMYQEPTPEETDKAMRAKRVAELVNAGIHHFREKDLARARKCWQTALQLDNNCKPARRNLQILENIVNPQTC